MKNQGTDDLPSTGCTLDNGTLTVLVPPTLHRKENIQNIKYALQMDIFRFVSSINRVQFLESYDKS